MFSNGSCAGRAVQSMEAAGWNRASDMKGGAMHLVGTIKGLQAGRLIVCARYGTGLPLSRVEVILGVAAIELLNILKGYTM
jgi:hypothetical protein